MNYSRDIPAPDSGNFVPGKPRIDDVINLIKKITFSVPDFPVREDRPGLLII